MNRHHQTCTFPELLRVFFRIGCISFGGPAGQIALLHREVVDDRGWISEEQFLHALNFCHLLPGPEAMQLATWIGWKLRGVRGGLAAGMLFVLPGALLILALSWLYAVAASQSWFAALFLGIKAAVLAIVAQALWRISARSLNTGLKRALAAMAFAALFLLDLPFPAVVLAAGLIGMVVAARRPGWLGITAPAEPVPLSPRPWRQTASTIAIWGAIWAAPMVLILITLGRGHVLWEIGSFFAQLAIVTFGGAYAVLAYMAQEAVQGYGWLSPGEMADGLGMAETTPGPLILVTQFVGTLAAFRAADPFHPLVAGLLGAGLTTWVTFAPCFLWIFALAPWMERMENAPRLKGGLAALTAAIVGVIANLALWFALHVLFASVERKSFGPLRLHVPDPASLDGAAAVLTVVALVLLFGLRWSVLRVLAVTALGGLALSIV